MAGMQQACKQSPALNQVTAGVYVFPNSISNEIGKKWFANAFSQKERNETWLGSF